MAVLYTEHFVQFFDDNGDPLSGGKLYAYSAGTTTPKATYTTEDASVENANPVILDSAGRATIFIVGSYRFDLFDANDVLIKSTDDVTSFTTLNESGEPFFQSFSGTGSQTIFTLSESLGTDSKDIMVFVDAGGTEGYEIQNPSAYTLSGTSLTFGSAPASGTDNIYVYAPTKLLGAAAASAAAAAASEASAAASATTATTAAASAAIATKWRPSADVATTANVTLSGEQTIDNVLTSASRILVKDQTDATENGVYVTAAGAWSRATDADTWDELTELAIQVTAGTVNFNKSFSCIIASGGTLGVDDVTFTEILAFPIDNLPQDFRLTLTSATPVTTSDVTGATTIYCTPYLGNKIALYNTSTSEWNVVSSAEFSLALGTLTSGLPYDVFCYNNSGTATLEFLAWTNDTTRATALAYQNGILVESGDASRRYLGTFYTTSTTETEDSIANRYLWNYYHRACRKMLAADATDSWNYSTASYRQANGSTANQINFVVGVSEDAVDASVHAQFINSGASSRQCYVGIGLDSTTASAANIALRGTADNATHGHTTAYYKDLPGIGRHYLANLEYGAGADTQTWLGDANIGAGRNQTGIIGSIWG